MDDNGQREMLRLDRVHLVVLVRGGAHIMERGDRLILLPYSAHLDHRLVRLR